MKLLIIAFLFSLISCTNEAHFEKGKQQLEQMGYKNIESTGYSAWCCGEEDDFKQGFKAEDSQGRIVSGCICSGFAKGITVRFK